MYEFTIKQEQSQIPLCRQNICPENRILYTFSYFFCIVADLNKRFAEKILNIYLDSQSPISTNNKQK